MQANNNWCFAIKNVFAKTGSKHTCPTVYKSQTQWYKKSLALVIHQDVWSKDGPASTELLVIMSKLKLFLTSDLKRGWKDAASKTSIPEELVCKMAPTSINVFFVSVRGKYCILSVQIITGTSPLVSAVRLLHECFILGNTYVVTHLSFQPWNGIKSPGNTRNWVQGTDTIIQAEP